MYGDQRLSVDITRAGFPYQNAAFRETASRTPPSFLNMDDPDHARIRRMVTAPFAIKRIEAMRPTVQRMTDGFIDTMLAGPNPVDLVGALALPLPSLVICDLLGVPYDDHDFFQSNSKVGLRRDVTPEESRAAAGALLQYLDEQLEAKLADPADDMLSDLAARVRAGELTRPEAGMLGLLLLGAGHEPTANMIALGVLAFLEHPDQLAVVRDTDDPKVGWNSRSSTAPSSAAFPPRAWPPSWRRSRSRRTAWSTASTNCRSPGNRRPDTGRPVRDHRFRVDRRVIL